MICRRVARLLVVSALVLPALGGLSACRSVDLSQALDVTDVLGGYYDDGVKAGNSHIVPSITFRLHNKATESISGVQLTVAFWPEGADGELDSRQVRGIGSEALAPGASTEAITVRSDVGFSVEGPRAEMFGHHLFKDFTAKIFAKRAGAIIKIGEFKLDRRLFPHTGSGQP
jgi:hypothetical protein